MLHGHYIGYQPNYLETFYSSLDLASKQDSSAYILVFQLDSNPQYNKLLAKWNAGAYNMENNTTMTPVVYGRLQDEFEDALEDGKNILKFFAQVPFDDQDFIPSKYRSTYRAILRTVISRHSRHIKRYSRWIRRLVGDSTTWVPQSAQYESCDS